MGIGGVPIDRGYAWVIVAGAFLNLVILLGVAKSMGIIFVALREYYQRSATATVIFYPLIAGCSLLTAPMVTALTELLSIRLVCMTGSILLTLSLIIGYAGGSLEAIIFPYGILGGLGVGMVLTPAPLIISRYFRRRKALAMGILFAGSGVGGILGPFVITAILDNFGLHGSILLIGALSLNTAIGGALYRPLSYWKSPPTVEPKPVEAGAETSLKATQLPLLESAEPAATAAGEPDDEHEHHASGLVHVASLSLSNLDLPTTLLETSGKGLTPIAERSSPREPKRNFLKRLLHRRGESGEMVPLLHTAILKEPEFVLFSAGCLCGMSGFYWAMLTPAYTEEDLGMSAEESARLLSVMGLGDLAGRLIIAATGDGLLAKHRTLSVGLALVLVGAGVLGCPFVPDFWSQAACLVMGQMGFGCFVALSPVALGDLVPPESLASAWGFLLFFEGIGHIATPLLIGVIKDSRGTYFLGYFLVAGVCFLGGILIAISAFLHSMRQKRETLPPTPPAETTHSTDCS